MPRHRASHSVNSESVSDLRHPSRDPHLINCALFALWTYASRWESWWESVGTSLEPFCSLTCNPSTCRVVWQNFGKDEEQFDGGPWGYLWGWAAEKAARNVQVAIIAHDALQTCALPFSRLESGSPEGGSWGGLRGSHSPSPPSPMAGVGSPCGRRSSFGRASASALGRGNPPLVSPSTPPRGRGFRLVWALVCWSLLSFFPFVFSQDTWRSQLGGVESNVCWGEAPAFQRSNGGFSTWQLYYASN